MCLQQGSSTRGRRPWLAFSACGALPARLSAVCRRPSWQRRSIWRPQAAPACVRWATRHPILSLYQVFHLILFGFQPPCNAEWVYVMTRYDGYSSFNHEPFWNYRTGHHSTIVRNGLCSNAELWTHQRAVLRFQANFPVDRRWGAFLW